MTGTVINGLFGAVRGNHHGAVAVCIVFERKRISAGRNESAQTLGFRISIRRIVEVLGFFCADNTRAGSFDEESSGIIHIPMLKVGTVGRLRNEFLGGYIIAHP